MSNEIRIIRKTKQHKDDILEKVSKLLIELDYYMFNEPDLEKVTNIEKQLEKIKTETKFKDQELLTTYPDITHPNFQKLIYLKKEFNKNKYQDLKNKNYDELYNEYCSNSNKFRLSNTQVFVKNFLSPFTPYNGILLFHGVLNFFLASLYSLWYALHSSICHKYPHNESNDFL